MAEFSYPSEDFSKFFDICGYVVNHMSTKVPFLEFDTTPYSIKLPPFLKRITSLNEDHSLYKRSIDLFTKIRNGRLSGISGFDFISYLRSFGWIEADNLSLVIRNIVNSDIRIENVYIGLEEEKVFLEKIRVVLVPSRAERWLSKNNLKIKLKVDFLNKVKENDIFNKVYTVTACAVGDSLASTDFRHGLGINRGFHSAIRLFEDKIDPEKVRKDLVKNGYLELDIFSDENVFNRAISCRDWLISK